jgi:hypothetical protein
MDRQLASSYDGVTQSRVDEAHQLADAKPTAANIERYSNAVETRAHQNRYWSPASDRAAVDALLGRAEAGANDDRARAEVYAAAALALPGRGELAKSRELFRRSLGAHFDGAFFERWLHESGSQRGIVGEECVYWRPRVQRGPNGDSDAYSLLETCDQLLGGKGDSGEGLAWAKQEDRVWYREQTVARAAAMAETVMRMDRKNAEREGGWSCCTSTA